MRKTYKAKLVQQDRLGYNQFDIIKAALSSDIYQCKMGDIRIATHDHSANAFWQAQRLVITDETPYQDIKSGYVLCPDGVSVVNVIGYEADLKKYWCVVSGAKCLIDGSDYKKVIAAYPTIPDVPQIGLSDIRRWVDEGCKESVELEVELSDTYTRDGLQPRLSLTNNTVKMVWGEQDKAQPIAGDNGKPIVVERFACNGEHSHWEVIEPIDGAILWSGEDHHPATDWEAMRDKFFKDAPLFNIDKEIAKRIADYFKNELTK